MALPASFPGDKSLSGAGRGQPQAILSCGKLAQLQEDLLPILVVSEDRLPLIPVIHHVINRPGILDAQFA